MIHFPHQTKGCYYQRWQDCCWLCMVRYYWAVFKVVRKDKKKPKPEKKLPLGKGCEASGV